MGGFDSRERLNIQFFTADKMTSVKAYGCDNQKTCKYYKKIVNLNEEDSLKLKNF